LCPACISTIPDILKKAKKNDNVAIYYYDFPLNIHPAAFTISKAAIYAKKHNLVKDLEYKIYTANFQEFNSNTQRFSSFTDAKTILDAFNKKIGTKITLKQINETSVQTTLNDDLSAGEKNNVRGTPTVILNGKKAFNEAGRTVSSRQKLFDILK
jgi:thiol:disulfide interchange protein DsbC